MGHAQGGFQVGILGKDGDLVGLAGAEGVLENHDAVALRTAALLTAIVDAFRDIHAATLVEIDIGRI